MRTRLFVPVSFARHRQRDSPSGRDAKPDRISTGLASAVLAAAILGTACAWLTPAGPRRPSPRGVAQAIVDGRAIVVEYGRPWRRDRTIFGGLVPYGHIWQTGADEATLLQTGVSLRLDGRLVPAGRYTIWTIPGRLHWTVILNRQTGQWGTDYDPSRDFLRVEVTPRVTRRMVDQFTIHLRVRGSRGTLALVWERTRVVVPFDVARPPRTGTHGVR